VKLTQSILWIKLYENLSRTSMYLISFPRTAVFRKTFVTRLLPRMLNGVYLPQGIRFKKTKFRNYMGFKIYIHIKISIKLHCLIFFLWGYGANVKIQPSWKLEESNIIKTSTAVLTLCAHCAINSFEWVSEKVVYGRAKHGVRRNKRVE